MPRRQRLTEAETERRMLRAATALIARDGLSLGVELSMETVIAEAGVARAAAYRRWPSRASFTADVLRALACEITVPTVGAGEIERLVERVRRRSRGKSRTAVAAELLSGAAVLDLDALLDSTTWRAHLLLDAVADSLAPGRLRDDVRRELDRAHEAHRQRIAAAYRTTADVLGLRLTRTDRGYDDLATLATHLVRGTVTQTLRVGNRAQAGQLLATGLTALLHDAVRDSRLPPEPGWAKRLVYALEIAVHAENPQSTS